MFDKKTEDAYIKMMFGEKAVRLPFFFIRQQQDDDVGLILAPERGITLAFGSKMPHVLAVGDMVFRPHLIMESRHLVGVGAAGIVTGGFDADDWYEKGKVLYKI